MGVFLAPSSHFANQGLKTFYKQISKKQLLKKRSTLSYSEKESILLFFKLILPLQLLKKKNRQICHTLSPQNRFSCIGKSLAKNLNVPVAKVFFHDEEIFCFFMQLSEGNFANLQDCFSSKSHGEDSHFTYTRGYKFLSSLQICKFAIQTLHTLSFKGK